MYQAAIGGIVEDLSLRLASSQPGGLDVPQLQRDLNRAIAARDELADQPLFRRVARARLNSRNNPGDAIYKSIADDLQVAYEINTSPGERLNDAKLLLSEGQAEDARLRKEVSNGTRTAQSYLDISAGNRGLGPLQAAVNVAQDAFDRSVAHSKAIAAANAAAKKAPAAKIPAKPASDTGTATKTAADTGPGAQKSIFKDLLTFTVLTSPAWAALLWLRGK